MVTRQLYYTYPLLYDMIVIDLFVFRGQLAVSAWLYLPFVLIVFSVFFISCYYG